MARRWLEESARLARASADGTMLGFALIFLGWAESHLGEPAAAAHMEEALAVLRAAGEPAGLVLALNVAVVPYVLLGDLGAAREALAEGLATARELGDDWALAVALSNAGFLDVRERNWPSAAVHLEQSLAIHLRLGDEGSVAMIYNNLAIVARQQGDDARAGALFERSIAQQRRLGLPGAVTLYNLGDWALRQGETSRAMTYLAEALRVSVRGGEQRGIAASLGGLARLAVAVGQPDVAARLIGGAEALSERAGVSPTPEQRRELERAAAVARAALGEEAFRAAVAGGEGRPTGPAHRRGAGLGAVLTTAWPPRPGAGCSWPGAARRPWHTRRPLAPRDRGAAPDRRRQEQPGDRRRAGNQPQHRGPPRQQRLRQGRRRQPHRGRRLRPPPWDRALNPAPWRGRVTRPCYRASPPLPQDYKRW